MNKPIYVNYVPNNNHCVLLDLSWHCINFQLWKSKSCKTENIDNLPNTVHECPNRHANNNQSDEEYKFKTQTFFCSKEVQIMHVQLSTQWNVPYNNWPDCCDLLITKYIRSWMQTAVKDLVTLVWVMLQYFAMLLNGSEYI